jgi:hypothetical protein
MSHSRASSTTSNSGRTGTPKKTVVAFGRHVETDANRDIRTREKSISKHPEEKEKQDGDAFEWENSPDGIVP